MYGKETAKLARQLRTFLLNHLKGIQEIPDEKLAIIGYGYGTGYKDLICTIMVSRSGLKLGLNKDAELSDPKKLLTGTGKVHRYVIIKDEENIHAPAVKQLLEEALLSYQKRKT